MTELKTKEDALNVLIKGCDTNKISDGYHTFGELYDHRIILFMVMCRAFDGLVSPFYDDARAWRSTTHSDGSSWDGWFLLGIGKKAGEQITYHLPMALWNECDFAESLSKAPEFDGHNSADVLERLKKLLKP